MKSLFACSPVTVVLPVHNAERTIALAIESAQQQHGVDVDVTVCDDASDDGTLAQLSNFVGKRLSYLRNSSNLGPGLSRDRAIDSTDAPWVAFLDADDAWLPERIGRLLSAAEASGADVVFDDTMLCHDGGDHLIPWKRVHGRRAFGGSGWRPRLIKAEDYIAAPRLLIHPLIRTSFIREHNIRHSSRRFAEDAEFYLRLAYAGATFCYVPEPLYLYRITPGSLTFQAKDHTLMRRCIEECAAWSGWPSSAQQAFITKITSLQCNETMYTLMNHMRAGEMDKAIRLLLSRPDLWGSLAAKIFSRLHSRAHQWVHGRRLQ